jgi:hypothetical protein
MKIANKMGQNCKRFYFEWLLLERKTGNLENAELPKWVGLVDLFRPKNETAQSPV